MMEYEKHSRYRIFGKHTLEQRYCQKCKDWYFYLTGGLDCDCKKSTANKIPTITPKDSFDLKSWRKEHRLTQVRAARLLGVSQPMIVQIEKGQRDLPAHHFKKIKRWKKEGLPS